jgi:hypothetical protein
MQRKARGNAGDQFLKLRRINLTVAHELFPPAKDTRASRLGKLYVA